MTKTHPLRPFLPADVGPLRELFAPSIDVLTVEDYNEDQRIAWAGRAEDKAAFGQRLASAITLVVMVNGKHAGFGALRDNTELDMLYVHPEFAGQGVGTTLADALERLAQARGAKEISAEVSDTAQPFFAARGYVPMQRNLKPVDDQWLSNTTMKKQLA
jgi:putative acetyltransferase